MSFCTENKRLIPFTQAEKYLLYDLIKKYKHIIENKKTDAVTNNEKKLAWKRICVEFNASDVTKRDDAQLKRCWEKTKTTAKKPKIAERQHAMKTGGGSAFVKKPEVEEVMTIVSSIQPHFDLDVNCPWDSNAVHLQEARNVTFDIQEVPLAGSSGQSCDMSSATLLETTDDVDNPDMSPTLQFGLVHPDIVSHNEESSSHNNSTPRAAPRKNSSFTVKSTRMVEAEVKKRIEKIDFEIEMLREAHHSRMRQDAEIHSLKMAREKNLLRISEIEKEIKEKELMKNS